MGSCFSNEKSTQPAVTSRTTTSNTTSAKNQSIPLKPVKKGIGRTLGETSENHINSTKNPRQAAAEAAEV